jgi:putative redox protein
MKARVKLIEGAAFISHADSGHALVIDGSEKIGGRNLGPRPMELVLQGLAGCSAMDVISMLRTMRQQVTDLDIQVEAERADEFPKVFTRIHLRYIVTGIDLKPGRVERAVEMSAEKYCSVSAMLASTATITHEIELRAAEALAEA